MQVLSRYQMVELLRIVCKEHTCTPQHVLTSLPYLIRDNIVLVRIDGLYMLTREIDPLPAHDIYPFVISVDGTPLFSQRNPMNAQALASRLCAIYTLARNIVAVDTRSDKVLIRWSRISVDQWIAKWV